MKKEWLGRDTNFTGADLSSGYDILICQCMDFDLTFACFCPGTEDPGGTEHDRHKRQTNNRLTTKIVDGVEVVVQGERL